MLVTDEPTRDAIAASHMWTMLSTLDLSIIKNWRPTRPEIYDEAYPLPLSSGAWAVEGVVHITHVLNFCAYSGVHGTEPVFNRVELIYRPPSVVRPRRVGVLRGETTAGVKFAFEYSFDEDKWYDCGWLVVSTERRLTTRDDVSATFGAFVSIMEDDRLSHFDPQILDAVGALPLPIAEQVAWCLAPPTLEDGLRRRGATDP